MKKKFILLIYLIFILLLSPLFAKNNNYPDMSFFKGTYNLIGKKIDSSEMYYGKAKIEIIKFSFKMTRIINKKIKIIYGKFNKDLPDGLSSLDFELTENGVKYLIRYQWYVDYDNYPVLSGFISYADKKTDEFGMEFLRSE